MKIFTFLFFLTFLFLFLLIQKPLFSQEINNPLEGGDFFNFSINEGTTGPLLETITVTDSFSNSGGDIGNNNSFLNTTGGQGLITTEQLNTSSNQFIPFLFIQEIFPKDTSEWGEYIRIGSSQYFSGSLRIFGAGTSSNEKTVFLEIQPNSFCVITDSPDLLLSGSLQCVINSSNMVLTDTGEPLELRVGDQLHHKIIYSNSSSIQPLHDSGIINSSGYTVFAPSLPFYTLSLLSQTGTLQTGITNVIISGENGIGNTGVVFVSGNNSFIKPFFIEEIYPFNELYPEFIELTALQNRSGNIIIQGIGQGSAAKTVFINTLSGIRRVITDDATHFGGYPFVISLDSISLTDGGEEIILKLGSGQEIDNSVYSGQQTKQSWLFTNSGDNLPILHPPTPGYSREMVYPHLGSNEINENQQTPVCGIVLQHEKPFYVTNKINLQAKINSTLIQNTTTTYSCERSLSGSDIFYFTGCNPSYLSFEVGIQPLILTIKKDNKVMCSISSALNIPFEKTLSQTQTSNTTEQEDKPSYYETLYRKRKERFEHLTSGIKKYGFSVNSSGDITGVPESTEQFMGDLVISGDDHPVLLIKNVLVNPKGKDSEGEQIIIEHIGLTGYLSDDIVLVRGKTTKGLPKGVLIDAQKITILSGDLGLINKPACIQLRTRKEKRVLGRTCYPQLKEGERFTGSLVGFTGKQEQERLQNIELIIKENKACVWIGETQIACESLPYDPKEVAQWKKDAKKISSITKKITTLQEKYDLWREKYKKQSVTNKKKEQTYLTKNRTLREDISKQKKKTTRYRNFYRLMRDQLGKEFAPIFSSQLFQSLDSLYDTLEIYEEFDTLSLGPLIIPIQEVESIYNLYSHGLLPLERTNTENVEQFIDQGTLKLNQFFTQ